MARNFVNYFSRFSSWNVHVTEFTRVLSLNKSTKRYKMHRGFFYFYWIFIFDASRDKMDEKRKKFSRMKNSVHVVLPITQVILRMHRRKFFLPSEILPFYVIIPVTNPRWDGPNFPRFPKAFLLEKNSQLCSMFWFTNPRVVGRCESSLTRGKNSRLRTPTWYNRI